MTLERLKSKKKKGVYNDIPFAILIVTNRLAEDANFTPNVYHRYGWTPLVSVLLCVCVFIKVIYIYVASGSDSR
jgi:hypothetical protein